MDATSRAPRLAVVGKGGAGKSVVAATLARLLARRGHRVLALDSDTLPGLSLSLGADVPDEPPLNAAAEQNEQGRWHLKRGIGPVRAVQRFSTEAPDGVRVLQIGKTDRRGLQPVRPSHNAFFQIIHRIDVAQRFLLVVEPTWQSMLTARRIARIARTMREDADFSLVVNKVTAEDDAERVQEFLDIPLTAVVPADEGVRSAERAGVALLDHAPDSPVVDAIERLADTLDVASMQRS